MNRADRLRRLLPGAPEDMITELAARPWSEIGRWIPAIQQAEDYAVKRQVRWQRQRRAKLKAEHDQAVTVACPYCGVQPGEHCRTAAGQHPGTPMSGRWAHHRSRYTVAASSGAS